MRTRDVYLINAQTLKDSDTVTLDITKGLKILFLVIQYEATNGATSNTLRRINSMISKLSVVEASSVLHALSMREEQAKNFFDYKRMPYQLLTDAAGGTVRERAVIDFRRMPGDKNFYLDTSRYTNPQIQLTHALTISATAGFATGTGKLTVIARVIDSGAAANSGFVMAKELDSFASAASGDNTTDLPLDFPISHLLVQNPVNAKTPDNSLSNFKLTADTDAYIPINETYLDLLRDNADEYGPAEQSVELLSGGQPWTDESDIYFQSDALVSLSGPDIGAFVTAIAGNENKLAIPAYYPTGAAANTLLTAGAASYKVRGFAPHSTVIYRFGNGMDPEDLFSPTGVGKFQLKLTNAATGATPKVVVVQQHA